MSHNRKIIYLAGFVFALSIALVYFVNSSFLASYIGEKYVGIAYTGASLFTILSMLLMPKILSRFGNRATILIFSTIICVSFLLLAFGKNTLLIIPAFSLYFASVGFVTASLDIFLEDFSKRNSVGKWRGAYLAMINLAWIAAQIFGSFMLDGKSFGKIYIFGAVFMAIIIIVFSISLKEFKDPVYRKIPVLKTLKAFIKNKHLSRVYLSSFVLQFFYAWMAIYMPIYLHNHMGFTLSEIAIIFSIMLIPFVILDFPLGKLSDKMGEKKMLICGFIAITIFTFIIPFIKIPELWLWAGILFATRLGAATIEIMNESYFFKVVREEDADEISFFRNAPYVAYIVAPLLATILLFILPSFEYLFFILTVILFTGFLISLRLKDVK